jgi:nucleotide-binding universal stress UspA family protein
MRKGTAVIGIQTILHPTDFSPSSEYAFRFARALARDQVARLIVLHIGPKPLSALGAVPPLPEEYGRAELEKMLRKIQAPELKDRFETRLAFGEPVSEILNAAHSSRADLIVVGTHGRTGLGRLLMGSVAEQLLRQAPCPVVTVRAGVKA